jgi:hypothetical protein
MRSINAAVDTEAEFSLSAALFTDSKDVPSQFYYIRDEGDINHNRSEWTNMRVEAQPARTGLTELEPILINDNDDTPTSLAKELMNMSIRNISMYRNGIPKKCGGDRNNSHDSQRAKGQKVYILGEPY